MGSLGGELRRHVEELAAQPRHRRHPGSMERARTYCVEVLSAAGWRCEEQPFEVRPAVRMSDEGWPSSPLALRWLTGLRGVNLVASPTGVIDEGSTLVIAHLDTVRTSPGADDNASGVAVALALAAQLSGRQHQCAIALVDLEEMGQLGARALMRDNERPAQVICLESIGYFDPAPGAQRMPPGFRLLFPEMARQVKDHDGRADFLVAVHRANSRSFAEGWAHAASALGLRSVLLRDRRWNGRGQRLTRWVNPLMMDLDRSDHAPFWQARVPAVMLTGTAVLRNARYHRPTDTPDTLDYLQMARATAALTAVLTA